eukprot:680609-Hanusia_phi.AAC.1
MGGGGGGGGGGGEQQSASGRVQERDGTFADLCRQKSQEVHEVETSVARVLHGANLRMRHLRASGQRRRRRRGRGRGGRREEGGGGGEG